MQQSTLPYFLRVMEGLGKYNSANGEFKTNWGPTCYARTGTDPNSIVGIPNVRAAWVDEAGMLSLYFSENLRARAMAKGARVLFSTSPYSRNWIWRDYIKPKLAGNLKDLKLIQAPSWENPYHKLFDPIELSKERDRMDVRRFNMIYGGEFGTAVGLVYDCWDDDQNFVLPLEMPMNTKFYGGVDWGFTDPSVLKVRAVTPEGKHYGISEFYKVGMTLSDMIEVAKQKKQTYNIQTFYADPSQPGHIEEFNRRGLPCIGADNDIRRGIDLHYSLIKERKYKEFIGTCPYSADERSTYHYPEPKDLGPDQKGKDQLPVGQGDHCMDVDRYLTLMTYRTGIKHVPKVPGDGKKVETNEQRINRLKRGRTGKTKTSENWS